MGRGGRGGLIGCRHTTNRPRRRVPALRLYRTQTCRRSRQYSRTRLHASYSSLLPSPLSYRRCREQLRCLSAWYHGNAASQPRIIITGARKRACAFDPRLRAPKKNFAAYAPPGDRPGRPRSANALARLTPVSGPHHYAPGRSRTLRDCHAECVSAGAYGSRHHGF